MNAEMMQQRWSELRREAQQRWNRLTDEEREPRPGSAEIQAAASTGFTTARDFVADNPWVGIAAGILLLALLAGLLTLPRLRRY